MTVIEGIRLVLVRHAMPVVDPAVSAEWWRLGPDGRAAARAIGPRIARPAYYVASPQPKAAQTVQEIAGPAAVMTDADLGEVRRPHVWSDHSTYRSTAYVYVEGVRHDGWESHKEVVRRFDRAVARHATAAAQAKTLVIGTHGIALTIWLATRRHLKPNPAQFWAALRFPDLIELDLRRDVGQWQGIQAP